MTNLKLHIVWHPWCRGTVRRGVPLMLLPFMILLGCNADPTRTDEHVAAYHVVDGACGDLVLVEEIGTDSAAALVAIEARKVQEFGENNVVLDLLRLSVVDPSGDVPEPNFYGVRVLDAETGLLAHSMSEVINTEGVLFSLWWCPD